MICIVKAEKLSSRLHNQTNKIKGKLRRRRKKKTDRITQLLIVILILFIVTEFPKGLLGVLAAVFGEDFFVQCYSPLGELMDIVTLVNFAINFLIYCAMSRQFRLTLKKIVHYQRPDQETRKRNSVTGLSYSCKRNPCFTLTF